MIVLQCTVANNIPYDGMEEDIEWILDGEEKTPNWLDTAFTKLGFDLSMNALVAEACLELATLIDKCKRRTTEKRDDVLAEGVRYSSMAEKKMKCDDSGNIVAPVKAYEHHSKFYRELRSLCNPV
mmetsp:Transcript_19369/g.29497  ORF Transcript_19369/g.29497 Transcript_19369/m.29497 type:complete len:125 (+) Transcript_19369:746-1120(+)